MMWVNEIMGAWGSNNEGERNDEMGGDVMKITWTATCKSILISMLRGHL